MRKNEEAFNQLSKFIGSWDTEGTIPSSSQAPEIKIIGTDTYEWIVDGFFVLHQADVTIGKDTSKTHEIIGYDSLNQHYTMQHYDNQGNSGLMTATVHHNSWTFTGDSLRFKGGFNEIGDVFSGVWEQLRDDKTWFI
ncbi:DUF1579 family protein [Pedobacter gandavensis]|uniref:DUF1579 domain-containing protein n=1 Tax=Pedobacter gandavensis TaxID=2679963 RepID=A0ABR6ETR7_9SPHI|nr:DUF1579 family protein [Pedobacter gandavensis]MBB2148659.1 DUF1579 domain-containing protein [Pedobacter gandavensis]